MVDKTENEVTPLADAKIDVEGVLAMLAALMNAANQGTSGSTAGTVGNTSQMGTGTNASETSIKAQTDINAEESMAAYVGLAVNNATGHLGRVNTMAEQILQNAISQANVLSNNTISQIHKRTVDQDKYANSLDFQALRNTDVATDRIWNLDEQIAAAEVLYAALGRYLSSTKVENPA
jgi:hypothetical protein